jgi:uncharacterized phage protein (TIGR01671 family)
MREIKFRGKRADNGEWVYGYYVWNEHQNKHYIGKNPNSKFWIEDEVIPETVGQYTGLKDKNGKEIYEGDVMKNWDAPDRVVEFNDFIYWMTEQVYTSESVEITGNIHYKVEQTVD